MFITNSIAMLHNELDAIRFSGGRRRCVSLVTLRGGLHDGHGAVINAARTVSDVLVVALLPEAPVASSVIVDDENNVVSATEFHDIGFVEQHDAQIFFKPTEELLFPIDREPLLAVTSPDTDTPFACEAHALLTHLKILNIVQPEIMVWGEKKFIEHFQVRRLIRELDIRTQLQCIPTVRHANGVPVGDEDNAPESADDETLPVLYETIKNAAHAIRSGARSFDKLARTARRSLKRAGFEVNYFHVLDEDTLQPASDATTYRIAAQVTLDGRAYADSLGLTL